MKGTNSQRPARLSVAEALGQARTQGGESLAEMCQRGPLLLIFLRHFGCTFCREALADVAARRAAIVDGGTQVAFVHLGSEQEAAPVFARYGLSDVARVTDPDAQFYRAFELRRGRAGQILGVGVWWRGFKAFLRGYLPGRWVGDVLRMPGAFLVYRGEILRAYRHATVADRPDYESLAACEIQR